MNHDACHCADYKSTCPKTCYRARLTKEYYDYGYSFPVTFAYLKETTMCPLNPKSDLNEADVE